VCNLVILTSDKGRYLFSGAEGAEVKVKIETSLEIVGELGG